MKEVDSTEPSARSSASQEGRDRRSHIARANGACVSGTSRGLRPKKVFVSGCFDMLHSGHIKFLENAAAHGTLFVGIGSDETIRELKGRYPINSQEERKYMLEALTCVERCFINRGSGIVDFADELRNISPDIFVVNQDGDLEPKSQLCRQLGIKYVVLKRDPQGNLPARSTSGLLNECDIPYRIDLAGGWLDQPFVSKHAPGPVINICIEPTLGCTKRCGLASSSRRRAIELWRTRIPHGDREKLAKMLFLWENPPGTKIFSGSQDAIGIVFPGLNRLDYAGDYWPAHITSVHDESCLSWIEKNICLIKLPPRSREFDPLKNPKVTKLNASRLSSAADQCWEAILRRDAARFGHHLRESFEAQTAMFPDMLNDSVRQAIRRYADTALGWKLSGAGGGGYLILVSTQKIPGAVTIKIRRKGRAF